MIKTLLAFKFNNPFNKIIDNLDSKMDLSVLDKLPWPIIIAVFAAIAVLGIVLIWARIFSSARKSKTSKQVMDEPNIVSSEIFEDNNAERTREREIVKAARAKIKPQAKKAIKATAAKKRQGSEIPWSKPVSLSHTMIILSQGQIPDTLGWIKVTNTASGSVKLYKTHNLFSFTMKLLQQMKEKVPARTREVLAVQLLAADNKHLTDAQLDELHQLKCIEH